jgi:hypothetical protein
MQQREERKAAEAAEGRAEEVAAGTRLEEHGQNLGYDLPTAGFERLPAGCIMHLVAIFA